ncbi:MAG: hypothetical protein IKV94_02405 [Clostridia bacterium]|nr:hypothetical protein [Clostridia bacterium]
MNKKEFTTYINKQLEGKTLDQQLKILQKIQGDYIPTLIQKRMKKLGLWVEPEKKDQYMLCNKCRKYHLIKKCKVEIEHEVRTEYTYIDAGYGDDDMLGEVEYLVRYITCPACGNKQEKSKMYLKKRREWNRREGK